MGLDAWGDDGAEPMPEGWWSDDQVKIVQQCISELCAERFYEDGQMAKGVSVRFLARLSILRGEAGLIPTDGPEYQSAERVLSAEAH